MDYRTFNFGLLLVFMGVVLLYLVYTNREALKAKIKNYEIIFRYVLGTAFIISGIVIVVLSFNGLKLRFRGDPHELIVNEHGFTDRTEAKNQLVNGVKEGKWCEYVDSNDKVISDTDAECYRLATYKAGKLNGIVREYYKSGELRNIVSYREDSIYGAEKWYYPNGKLEEEDPLTIDGKANGLLKGYDSNGVLSTVFLISNNKANGIRKDYYASGKLMAETPYTNDMEEGVEKDYYEDGKLKAEIKWVNDSVESEKDYDESGHEIKQ